MWGSWYGAAAIGAAAALVLVASAFFAWALLPVAIALFVIAGIAVYRALQGGREEVAARDDEGPIVPADEPEHQPRQTGEHGGFWGEKEA